jgi:hypothetical protein
LPETRDDGSGGEPDVESLERHYRVTLDFRLRLRPLTPEVCRESCFFRDENASADEPSLRESVERQRRLLALLRKNERVLERYLLTVVAQQAAGVVFGGLAGAFGVAEDEDLLAPLYAQMPEEDARYFEGRAGEELFWERAGPVAKAFGVEWVGAEWAEMNRRLVGDLRRVGGGRAGEYTHAPTKES